MDAFRPGPGRRHHTIPTSAGAPPGIELDLDVLEIAEDEWAIHGRLAYEGQVIAATFTSEREAWTALTAFLGGQLLEDRSRRPKT